MNRLPSRLATDSIEELRTIIEKRTIRSRASCTLELTATPRLRAWNVVGRTCSETSMPRHGSSVASTARRQSSVERASGMRAPMTSKTAGSIPAARARRVPSMPRASSARTSVAVQAASTVGSVDVAGSVTPMA